MVNGPSGGLQWTSVAADIPYRHSRNSEYEDHTPRDNDHALAKLRAQKLVCNIRHIRMAPPVTGGGTETTTRSGFYWFSTFSLSICPYLYFPFFLCKQSRSPVAFNCRKSG